MPRSASIGSIRPFRIVEGVIEGGISRDENVRFSKDLVYMHAHGELIGSVLGMRAVAAMIVADQHGWFAAGYLPSPAGVGAMTGCQSRGPLTSEALGKLIAAWSN